MGISFGVMGVGCGGLACWVCVGCCIIVVSSSSSIGTNEGGGASLSSGQCG